MADNRVVRIIIDLETDGSEACGQVCRPGNSTCRQIPDVVVQVQDRAPAAKAGEQQANVSLPGDVAMAGAFNVDFRMYSCQERQQIVINIAWHVGHEHVVESRLALQHLPRLPWWGAGKQQPAAAAAGAPGRRLA